MLEEGDNICPLLMLALIPTSSLSKQWTAALDECLEDRTHWMDGWMDGRVDGRVDGWVDPSVQTDSVTFSK